MSTRVSENNFSRQDLNRWFNLLQIAIKAEYGITHTNNPEEFTKNLIPLFADLYLSGFEHGIRSLTNAQDPYND